jgi:hypothetical protein
MEWQAYRGVTAIGGIAASGSQWVLFRTERLTDPRRRHEVGILSSLGYKPLIIEAKMALPMGFEPMYRP